MQLTLRNGRWAIEYQIIIFATCILAWCLYYLFSTIVTPDGGKESVLFIKPLTILLCLCYPFVVLSSFKRIPLKTGDAPDVNKQLEFDKGFLDRRRLVFAAALIVYSIALTFWGYLIPSILFILFICFYLGVRNLLILFGLPIILSSFLSIVFNVFIGVPIPIWPW